MAKQWKHKGLNRLETTRRLIDLFFVAVLLDAGAGDVWKFAEPNTDQAYGRSEGIAVASLYMFKSGAFSSNNGGDVELVDGQSLQPLWICARSMLTLPLTGHALLALDVATFEKHFQITSKNPLVGTASRVSLLKSVGSCLLSLPKYFGENGRPGNLVGMY